MPRPKRDGVVPKTRSRHGCWPCKSKKIKCGEERPSCQNCQKQSETCDYTIRLNWEGRGKKRDATGSPWSSEHITLTPRDSQSLTPSTQASPPAIRFESQSPSSKPVGSGPTSTPFAYHSDMSWNDAGYHVNSPRAKRKRETPEPTDLRTDIFDSSLRRDRMRPSANIYDPHHSEASFSMTPSTSGQSLTSSDSRSTPVSYSAAPNQHRLSVQYLLQDSSDADSPLHSSASNHSTGATSYGFDQGLPDLDIPNNDDLHALILQSPATATKRLSLAGGVDADARNLAGFGFGLYPKDAKFQRIEYYSRPVPVLIPRALEPLPRLLLDNPMNLLYFHHFLNHTARILVPHDCPENPFRNLLPEMAVHDENLLNLLLAYAAGHRSSLLNHRDPANRIALLVRKVFPSLRHALEQNEPISDSNLATAIMLTSLEIVSPSTFEVDIPWVNHLTIARQMIIARGGFSSFERSGKAPFFLSRWFAYLDVHASLSGSKYDSPLQYSYLSSYSGGDPDDDTEIDCLLGFTTKVLSILAKIADLARRCDGSRIGLRGFVRQDWQPTLEIVEQAEGLKQDLQAARPTVFRRCAHQQADIVDSAAESLEMLAINDAYHWAGLIHLHRRILGKLSYETEVQTAVHQIAALLDRIRHGSSAEATMIMPMFAAGCEAIEQVVRDKFLQRMMNVEQAGMTQVHRARTLMQKVWITNKPWETLVSGEFFG